MSEHADGDNQNFLGVVIRVRVIVVVTPAGRQQPPAGGGAGGGGVQLRLSSM